MLTRGHSSGLRRPGFTSRLAARQPDAATAPHKPPAPGAAAQADEQALMELARQHFMRLQAAWDRADFTALAALTAAPLMQDLRNQLAQRGPGPHHTEVLHLQVRLLALQHLPEARVASVEFTGMIREHPGAPPVPFRELWLLADVPASGRGWQLACVQSLS